MAVVGDLSIKHLIHAGGPDRAADPIDSVGAARAIAKVVISETLAFLWVREPEATRSAVCLMLPANSLINPVTLTWLDCLWIVDTNNSVILLAVTSWEIIRFVQFATLFREVIHVVTRLEELGQTTTVSQIHFELVFGCYGVFDAPSCEGGIVTVNAGLWVIGNVFVRHTVFTVPRSK